MFFFSCSEGGKSEGFVEETETDSNIILLTN